MRYIPNTESTRKKMLQVIGVDSIDALLAPIPEQIRLKELLKIPAPRSEFNLIKDMKALASKTDVQSLSFLGAGVYRRFIPSAVAALISRAEYLTAYTPYQPEISQGTLQAMFEFQTLLSQLTGMDVANASMYEAASATAEAVVMATRIHRKGKKVLVSAGLHPEYMETVRTYLQHMDLEIIEIPLSENGQTDLVILEEKVDASTLCVVTQMVNFFGVIEPMRQIGDLLVKQKAMNIAVLAEMSSLGLLTPPGECDVDIFVGEGQSLGLSPSFGGPNLGIFACRKKHLRQIPGRLAGKTVDQHGKPSFCLTLATREQHIRREKATSNICSNQMLCALAVSIYLALMGKKGMMGLAQQNLSKAHFALGEIKTLDGYKLRYQGQVYNEFVLELPIKSDDFLKRMKKKGINAGVALSRFTPKDDQSVLLNFTEVNTREEIEQLIQAMKEVI